MGELTQAQVIGIAIACAVVILAAGLGTALGLAMRNVPAKTPPQAVVPPVNPGGVVPQKSLVCSPASPNFAGRLQPCEKTSTCGGCVEFTDTANAYKCVTVGGTNQMGVVDASGNLVHPVVVDFFVPPSNNACSGHGQPQSNGTCVCDAGFVGDTCNIIPYRINQPGSYCLPQYSQACSTATSNSMLVNTASGKGGQFACECKPEYEGMFVQAVEGGSCDTPLICGGSQPELGDDLQPRMFSVHVGFDAKQTPLFQSQPVYSNYVGAVVGLDNALVRKKVPAVVQECVARVGPVKQAEVLPGGKPYTEATLAGDADPRCKPLLHTNFCEAPVYSSASGGPIYAVLRGSNKPGDPLRQRVYPRFYRPVPPRLQRCPDGYTGQNTFSQPCKDVNNKVLTLKRSTKSYCDVESIPSTDYEKLEYEMDTYNHVFTDDGEWSGYFTCVNDVRTALNVTDPANPVPVSKMKWNTVSGTNLVTEVKCGSASDYLTRVNEGQLPPACKGAKCEGVKGEQVKEWNGDTGALLNQDGLPWFAVGETADPDPKKQNFGGQCECNGTTFRRNAQGGMATTPVVPGYLVSRTGTDNWWSCLPDTCWSNATPDAYMQVGSPIDRLTDNPDVMHPHCVCNSGEGKGLPPYRTHISFDPVGETPVCIPDPCNPYGVKTTSQLSCAADSDCESVCHENKCYYPTEKKACTFDSDCQRVEQGAGVVGKCAQLAGSKEKVCLYEDVDRKASFCSSNAECSHGQCNQLIGKCSGGCACSMETVQQRDFTSPLGFTCKKRCEVYPCAPGHITKPCEIDATGKQVCDCTACWSGDRCDTPTAGSRKGDYCIPGKKADEWNGCCEGTCMNADTMAFRTGKCQ